MQFKTVSLIGLGALGIAFGQRLNESLPQGAFRVIASEERCARYRREGVRANGELCEFTYITPGQNVPPADLVIVATKDRGLRAAMDDMASQVGPDTVIISLLNGISSEEAICERWPGQALWCVALNTDATRVGQDLRFTKRGVIQFGERDGSVTPLVKALEELFTQAGIDHELHTDMLFQQWKKLMINTGLNQVTAVFDVPYGGIQKPGPAQDAMLAAMHEVVRLAHLEGVPLPEDAPEEWLRTVPAMFDPEAMPSMRQDVLAHRLTEVELFSGTVRRRAAKYGLPTPVNDMLYARLKALESTF